jgi:HSP20 family protein
MSDFTIDIEKQLNKLGKEIQTFVEKIVPLADEDSDFTPLSDIVESGKEFKILMDLPGMTKKEIRIALKERVLTISGERINGLSEQEELKRQERKEGVFSRSFAIPVHVKAGDANAQFKNGVLEITMPKADSASDAQSIPIK